MVSPVACNIDGVAYWQDCRLVTLDMKALTSHCQQNFVQDKALMFWPMPLSTSSSASSQRTPWSVHSWIEYQLQLCNWRHRARWPFFDNQPVVVLSHWIFVPIELWKCSNYWDWCLFRPIFQDGYYIQPSKVIWYRIIFKFAGLWMTMNWGLG